MKLSRLPAFLYPRRCPFCDRILGEDEPCICRGCSKKIRFIREPVCMRCGRPIENAAEEYCDNCRRHAHAFDAGLAPYVYGGEVQKSLMRFKYGGRAEYARFYGKSVYVFGGKKIKAWRPDLIVPVPVYPARYIRRGYNQAEELALELSRLTGIPADPEAVFRVRRTRPQKELKPGERRANLKGAFRTREGMIFPDRVLITDDIYTTGATIDELSGLLRKHGASHVFFASVSIAPGMS